jgi:selenocysteine lyase/cysteine desulfurase
LLDAIQGVGAVPLSVRESGVDAVACGAQKWLLGQTGSGFMYIAPDPVRPVNPPNRGWLSADWNYDFGDLQHADRPIYTDGRQWETGTYPFFAVRLSHAGLSILTEAGDAYRWATIAALLNRLDAGLSDSQHTMHRFAKPENASGIALIRGPQSKALFQHLKHQQIHTSFREGNIRVAPHFYNTEDDIDCTIAAIREFEEQA